MLALVAAASMSTAAVANAQSGGDEPGDPALAPPEGEFVEITKRTRDDHYSTAAFGPDGTLYVGTFQGRVYRSSSRGADWDETTVLPEVKPLWGYAGQYTLLGSIRRDTSNRAKAINLAPNIGVTGNKALSVLYAGLPLLHTPHKWSLPRPLGFPSRGGITSLNPSSSATRFGDILPDARGLTSVAERIGISHQETTNPRDGADPLRQTDYNNPLEAESKRRGGGSATALGAGLSARAPRLSLLQQALRRPVAALSLQVWLRTQRRNTKINRLAVDPKDADHLLSATSYGLYRSLDGGASWFRSFPGYTKSTGKAVEIIFDPHDPNRVFLGTAKGMFVSTDRGESFTLHGFLPEVRVNKIAFDPTDKRYIYIATSTGMYRSTDGGTTFSLAFFESLRRQRYVTWAEVDPFDPNRVYLGTKDGAFTTSEARTVQAADWQPLAGLRSFNLSVHAVRACGKRRGHLYAHTRADLPKNIYFGHGPENYLLETLDYGATWRVAASNRSQGKLNWFALDPSNCDNVYVMFSRAMVRLDRSARGDAEPPTERGRARLDPSLPSTSKLIAATLTRQGLELSRYKDALDRMRASKWLPSQVNVTFFYGSRRLSRDIDDNQFAQDRFLSFRRIDEWRIMAHAKFNLSDTLFMNEAMPMSRLRLGSMNNSVRERLMHTIHRHYRELLELRAERPGKNKRPILERALDRARAEQLEAIVDLASGGYLTDHQKEHNNDEDDN